MERVIAFVILLITAILILTNTINVDGVEEPDTIISDTTQVEITSNIHERG